MGLWRLSKFQTLGRKSKGRNLSMSCHPSRSQHLPWAKHRRGTSVGPANSVLVHLHPFLKQGTHVTICLFAKCKEAWKLANTNTAETPGSHQKTITRAAFWVFEWTSSLALELRSILIVFNSCGQFLTFPTKETNSLIGFLPKFHPLLQLGYSVELCFAKANEKIVLVEGQSTNLKDLVDMRWL